MRSLIRWGAAAGLLALTGALALSAPARQAQTIAVGDTITVNVPAEGPEAAVQYTLVIDEPTYLSMRASSADETDPVLLVRDSYGRDLTTVNDNPGSALAQRPSDAAIDPTLLIPGTYTVLVGRNTASGSGDVTFSVALADAGVIGAGQIQLVDGTIGENERFEQPIQLQEGQLVSLAAIGIGLDFDLRLNLRAPDNSVVARNDDNETFDIFLTELDPRIYQFRVPETGEYVLTVRAFNGAQTGSFKLVFQHHGTLSGEPRTDVITGETAARARNAFDVEFEAGEIVRITARADGGSLDPEIELLTADDIFIASNDDHGTQADDLGQFDARIERIVIEETGTYELDLNSVSGQGAFEVVIERLGVFSAGEFAPIEPGTGRVVTPAPVIVPEATEEPTSDSE